MHRYGIAAIHGGDIEPGTAEIARSIAENDYPLFINETGGHIPSKEFDNPALRDFLNQVETVISIHGQKDTERSFVMIGGLDRDLRNKLRNSLQTSGFIIELPPDELDGDNQINVCNRGTKKQGVQLEISHKLREELTTNPDLMEKFSRRIRMELK